MLDRVFEVQHYANSYSILFGRCQFMRALWHLILFYSHSIDHLPVLPFAVASCRLLDLYHDLPRFLYISGQHCLSSWLSFSIKNCKLPSLNNSRSMSVHCQLTAFFFSTKVVAAA